MRRPWQLGSVLACLLGTLPAPRVASQPAAAGSGSGPVLLELYTSQGCSSCPAAEELLSRLGLDERTRTLVVPLAYHVDYWDQAGWIDPFSQRAWTLRQELYDRRLRSDGGMYTPQLVVNGHIGLLGSDARRLQGELEANLRQSPQAAIRLEARPSEGKKAALSVSVAAELLEAVDSRKLELLVALFENGLVTRVGRGENGGRTLRNDFIVRRLERALSMEPPKAGRAQGEVTLKLRDDWRRDQLGVAAFLQDPRSLRVLGAAALHPPAPGAHP